MPDEVALARDYHVTLTVASQEWLDLANEQGISLAGLDVHLKVDSGMGRIGVRSLDEAENVIANLKKLALTLQVSLRILQQQTKLTIRNSMNSWNSLRIWLTI